jgi:N-acetyl-anhydromuramyl-L-alanine amidase AmpD
MDKTKIDTLVIHHDAVDRPAIYSSLKRLQNEARTHIAKGYGHISYHYSIDNIGDVYQCLPETEIAYHCGNLAINKKSLAIKIDGNLEFQQPTPKQVKAYNELIKYLTSERPDLPFVLKRSIKNHREIKPTACPGKNFVKIVELSRK